EQLLALGARAPALVDVGERAEEAAHGAVGLAERDRASEDPAHGAVVRHEAVLHVEATAGAHGLLPAAQDRGPVRGVHAALPARPQQLARSRAHELRTLLVREDARAALVVQEEADRRRLEQHPQGGRAERKTDEPVAVARAALGLAMWRAFEPH